MKKIQAITLLFTVTMIWGLTFPVQKIALDGANPFFLQFSQIHCLVLFEPVVFQKKAKLGKRIDSWFVSSNSLCFSDEWFEDYQFHKEWFHHITVYPACTIFFLYCGNDQTNVNSISYLPCFYFWALYVK